MLYVVRHGKTGWNDMKKTMGHMDIPLCKEGIEESEKMREELEDVNIDLIYTSPLTRAKETAAIINKSKNKEVIVDKRLVERNMGNLEFREYPKYEENERIWSLEENTDDYFMEPVQSFVERVYNFMDDVVKASTEQDVLLVTHGGVTAVINCYFNDSLDQGSLTTKFLKNGEIATYSMKKTKKVVLLPNDVL